MLSRRALRTLADAGYTLVLLTVLCALGLSCIALLSQAVRTAPRRTWLSSADAPVIGAAYVVLAVTSALLLAKRRIAVRRQLQRVSTSHLRISQPDAPKPVRRYIAQEYVRACLIVHAASPTDAFHEGWGRPGTKYADVYFRRALLDTIPEIESLVRLVIPSHPPLKPHARMLHHFRHLLPFLKSSASTGGGGGGTGTSAGADKTHTKTTAEAADEDGLTALHYYDAAVQAARTSLREPTQAQFEAGMRAAEEIKKSLNECRLEMMENASRTQVGDVPVAPP